MYVFIVEPHSGLADYNGQDEAGRIDWIVSRASRLSGYVVLSAAVFGLFQLIQNI